MRVWDTAAAAAGRGCKAVLRGHTSWVTSIVEARRRAGDKPMAVSAGGDGSIRVWSMHDIRCVTVAEDARECRAPGWCPKQLFPMWSC